MRNYVFPLPWHCILPPASVTIRSTFWCKLQNGVTELWCVIEALKDGGYVTDVSVILYSEKLFSTVSIRQIHILTTGYRIF
jgi:hypothetical protein